MKELLKQLEAAEQETIRLELKVENEIEAENYCEAREKAYDEACKKEFELYIALAKEIVKISKEKIDFYTARELIKNKRTELKALLERMA